MDQGIGVVIYPVSDLAQAKTLYRTLEVCIKESR